METKRQIKTFKDLQIWQKAMNLSYEEIPPIHPINQQPVDATGERATPRRRPAPGPFRRLHRLPDGGTRGGHKPVAQLARA